MTLLAYACLSDCILPSFMCQIFPCFFFSFIYIYITTVHAYELRLMEPGRLPSRQLNTQITRNYQPPLKEIKRGLQEF
jgi:hypothetical protein